MFNLKEYVQKLENIRKERLWSVAELIRELGIVRLTYHKMIEVLEGDGSESSRLSLRTQRTIKNYVDNLEKSHGIQ